ncbi:mechanosensitive ion channel family protein [Halomonas sp. PR-M31]|uniref:mechanosensitive ion channel family protein n=1 Tax=Halomonas sp. PR-M31 TaxID=1471202 RepID=UPI00069F7906|nr:mechanosensitive ion channel family protein [Halomonas sp. PR-M31]
MSFSRNWFTLFIAVLLLLLVTLFSDPSQAQGLAIPSMGSVSQDEKQPQQDPKELRNSLDDVISTLESDAQRDELLARLKELREASASASAQEGEERQGLLGALADSFNAAGEQAQQGRAPLDIWAQRSKRAGQRVESLFAATSREELLRGAIETSILMGVWLGLLLLLIGTGRFLRRRNDWPRVLPPEPPASLLIIHFLRKVLPWALSFAVMLGSLRWLDAPAPFSAIVLVLAYITLCGRLLATAFEVVISVFTRGHRRVAVALLRQQALTRLFVIGALAAFGDALNGDRLEALLGNDLSGWLSVSAKVLAGIVGIRLIIRIQRPIKHLIRNRPYAQRRNQNALRDLMNVLARLWHVPVLLLIGASLLAIFVTGGEAEGVFVRAIIDAALLVLALVIAGMLRRQSEKTVKRLRLSQYRRRLERFGYALAHLVIWVVFAELALRVWDVSLLGIGADSPISARIGRALLGIGLTVMLAWLIWIIADTGIQRALNTSARTRGRRVYNARAQTITPLLRNVVLVTIVIIASIVGLANLGVNVTPLLAGAGVIGLAIGFGAQTLVQDLITGLFILIEDSLAVGDFVKLGEFMGAVEGLTMRTVRLRDLDGVVHIIPFSEIKSIHNMSRQFGIALMYLSIPHTMKIDDATTLMKEVAEDLRKDPVLRHLIWSPLEFQGIQRFEEGAAVLRIRMRTKPEYQWDVTRAFNLRLKQRLDQDGQDLAMPRLNVVVQNAPPPSKNESWAPAVEPTVGHAPGQGGDAT